MPDKLNMALHPKLQIYLEALVATGFYGFSVNDAATILICEGVERRVQDGLLRKVFDKIEEHKG